MLRKLLVALLCSTALATVCFDDYGSGFSNESLTYLSNPLISSDNQAKQRFGKALDINGNRAVVCAYLTDSSLVDTGKCYVFVQTAGTWSQVQSFYGPNPGASDYFGYSVDMDGNWLIVGAPQDQINGVNYAGSATIYYWNGAAYVSPITVTRPVPTGLDMCGTAVGIQNGSYALMGCIGDDTVAPDGGLVYVFKLNSAGSVSYNGTLSAPNAANDNFGSAMAIQDSVVVIGAAAFDGAGSNSGKAYVYDLSNGILTLRYSFTPSSLVAGDQFGTAISISHPYILVGAPYYDGPYSNMGAAYLFYDTGSSATQLVRIVDSANPFTNAYFGSSLALFQTSPVRLEILVGEYNGRSLSNNNPTGTAILYLYDITTGQTRFVTEFLSSTGSSGDYFGGAVAASGRTFLIGSERQNTVNGGSSTGAGTAYIYTLATCTNQSDVCYTLSFDVDSVGVPLSAGVLMTTQYVGLGLDIISSEAAHPAILFDSSSPTCSAGTSIATPNVAYNGTGVGSGGTTTNSVDVDKILILQNNLTGCTPEVATGVGTFLFNFSDVINPGTISIVDGRTASTPVTSIAFYSDYNQTNLLGTVTLPYLGTDSVQTLSLSYFTSTVVMQFSLGGPAGIASFSFCAGNASVSSSLLLSPF
jgi:FG-GAP repeat